MVRCVCRKIVCRAAHACITSRAREGKGEKAYDSEVQPGSVVPCNQSEEGMHACPRLRHWYTLSKPFPVLALLLSVGVSVLRRGGVEAYLSGLWWQWRRDKRRRVSVKKDRHRETRRLMSEIRESNTRTNKPKIVCLLLFRPFAAWTERNRSFIARRWSVGIKSVRPFFPFSFLLI